MYLKQFEDTDEDRGLAPNCRTRLSLHFLSDTLLYFSRMSKLEKLMIQGIRSYSHSSPAVINFEVPITLIVGSNGAGKTTIIEALNYVTTGELPPGVKMTSFVHDPKVINETEVKGVIKLKFVDVQGLTCICTRSLVCTQKSKKMEAKSIEGCVVCESSDGSLISISSRCADLTKEMTQRFALSKSMFENVIFCHQENSCWPLTENKTLKEKFDELFSATKYMKALENIRASRKLQREMSKELQIQRNQCEIQMIKSNEIRLNLHRTEKKLLEIYEDIDVIRTKSKSLKTELEKVVQRLQDVTEINSKIDDLIKEKNHLLKSHSAINSMTKTIMPGSLEDLEILLKNELILEQTPTNLNEKLLDRKTELHCEICDLEEKKNNLVLHKERVLILRKQIISASKDFTLWMQETLSKFEYESSVPVNINHELDCDYLKECHKILENNFTSNVKCIESKFNDAGCVLTNKISETNYKMDELKEISNEFDKINQSSSFLSTEIEKLKEKKSEIELSIPTDVDENEEKLKSLKNHLLVLKSSSFDTDIDVLVSKKRNLTENDNRLKVLVENYYKNYAQQSELSSLNSQILTVLHDFSNVWKKVLVHLEYLDRSNLINFSPSSDIMEVIKDWDLIDHLATNIDSLKKSNSLVLQEFMNMESKTRMQVGEIQYKLQKNTEEISKLHQLMLNQREMLSSFLSDGLNEDEIEKILTSVSTSFSSGNSKIIKSMSKYKLLNKLFPSLPREYIASSNVYSCPLCQQSVDSIACDAKRIDMKIYKRKKKYETLIKYYKDEIENIKQPVTYDNRPFTPMKSIEHNIETLIQSSNRFNESLQKLDSHSTSCTESILKNQEIINILLLTSNQLEDVIRLRSLYFDLNSKIKSISCSDLLSSNEINLKEAEDRRAILSSEISELEQEIELCRTQRLEREKILSSVSEEINELLEKQHSNLQMYQQRDHLENLIEERYRDLETMAIELESCKLRKTMVEQEVIKLKSELAYAESKKHDIHTNLTNLKINHQSVMKAFEFKSKCLQELMESFVNLSVKDILATENEIQYIMQKKADAKRELDDITTKLTEITHDSSLKSIRIRNIRDNIELKIISNQLFLIEERILKFRRDATILGDMDSLKREEETLESLVFSSREKIAALQGNASGYQAQLTHFKAELECEMFKDADLKFQENIAALTICDMAGNDLDKFYKALDCSLMRFHQLKMKEINTIITEYWNRVYQCHDIEYIEIRSEESEGYGSSKLRRMYNYKVVMIKNGISLDMRSHCSAGQKVLACVIIRLALSEVFCQDCGILALDEPTTNLDRNNIESLANALIGLINCKRFKNHFQIIIITHDEDFVHMLCHARFSEYYYRIYKDECGFSTIHRQRVQDLLD